MKKLCLLLAAALCLCLCATSLAETTVREVTASDISLNRETGALAVRDPDTNLYTLTDPFGAALTTEPYTYMSALSQSHFFKVEVSTEDGMHDEGLIDSNGQVIIPPEYADVNVVDDRWQTAFKLTPCAADDKDYTFTNWSTNEKTFYRIDTVDFFFDGQKVGTLNRTDYDGYPTAHGAYICVTNREKQRFYYDSSLSSPRPADTSAEYTSTYKNGGTIYTHVPTGQIAFAPECTLTPDEVEQSVVYEKGEALDLQGNVIGTAAQNYSSFNRTGDGQYCRVRLNDSYGMITRDMREIIPCEYEDIEYYYDTLSRFGYTGAVKDGKYGFLDAEGNVTCDFVYTKEIIDARGTFATLTNLDGTTIVLSAAVGELPEHYASVEFPTYSGCMAFTAENAAGELGVVGLNGATLVPFSEDNRYISLSTDGLVVVVSKGNRTYDVYNVAPEDLAVSEKPAPAEPEAAADSDAWTCENGHEGNTGKFCTECGAPKPAEGDGTWTCENGHAGNTGKFCGECGAPNPANAG